MKAASIDLETLGTLPNSQILSIGAVIFDLKTGNIISTLYMPIKVEADDSINATLGTVKFWVNQAIANPKAIEGVLEFKANSNARKMSVALLELSKLFKLHKPGTVWANSPKFDLVMLEQQYRNFSLEIPWKFNADRCMRTIREFAGCLDVDFDGVAHNAVDDAIWQAKYISKACNKLGLV